MGTIYRKVVTKALPAGAQIVERDGRQIAEWIDGRGKRRSAPVTQGRDGTLRIVIESRTYTAKYRDGAGIVREVATGCRDKTAAALVLAELEKTAERVRAGAMSAAEAAAADWQNEPLQNHIEAFLDHQAAKGVTPTHRNTTRSRLSRIAAECRFARLTDLDALTLERWLAARQIEGMGAATRNGYREAWVAFANWCVRHRRLRHNPFAGIPKADPKADPRRPRRALTPDEVQRLLYAATWRPLAEFGRPTIRKHDMERPANRRSRATWRRDDLTLDDLPAAVARARQRLRPDVADRLARLGRERALIYKTLVLTGLRYGELRSIRLGQVVLDGPLPHLRLLAADAKSGQAAEVPLRGDLVADLRAFLSDQAALLAAEARNRATIPLAAARAAKTAADAIQDGPFGLPADLPLFDLPDQMTRIFDRDLRLAGIAKRDDRGRTADVHSLRHTFGTWLSRGGVAPRVAQAAMRHSTLELTMNVYTDPRLLDVAGALDVLPALPLTIQSAAPTPSAAAVTADGPGRPAAGSQG